MERILRESAGRYMAAERRCGAVVERLKLLEPQVLPDVLATSRCKDTTSPIPTVALALHALAGGQGDPAVRAPR